MIGACAANDAARLARLPRRRAGDHLASCRPWPSSPGSTGGDHAVEGRRDADTLTRGGKRTTPVRMDMRPKDPWHTGRAANGE